MHSEPAKIDVICRVRNRVTEYLELASSFAAQCDYQTAVRDIHVPHEVMNQFEDWVPNMSFVVEWTPAVFSHDERAALERFARVWDEVATRTADSLPRLEETLRLPEWEALRRAAEVALSVCWVRGKLPEEDAPA